MTAKDAPKERETWRDWLPADALDPGELLPRSKVLALAERYAAPTDERTMRYWEAEGLIPRPTHDHAVDGERARYPWWQVDLLWQVRQFKYWKWSNEKIRQHTPTKVRQLARTPPVDREWLLAPPDPHREHARVLLGSGLPYAIGPGLLPGDQPFIAEVFKDELRRTLARVAADFDHRYGIRVAEFTITLRTTENEGYPVASVAIDSDSTEGTGGRSY